MPERVKHRQHDQRSAEIHPLSQPKPPTGELDATSAVMGGRMQLSDMGLAMSLQGKMTTLFSKMNG